MPNDIHPKIPNMILFVPADAAGALGHVKKRSAIVGVPQEGRISCAYEGGIHQPDMPLSEKLAIACWRLSERSPNIAYAFPHASEVHQIAEAAWDTVIRAWVLVSVTDRDGFIKWFGEEPVIAGTREQHCRAAGLILRNGSNQRATMTMQMAKAGNRDPVEAIISEARAGA